MLHWSVCEQAMHLQCTLYERFFACFFNLDLLFFPSLSLFYFISFYLFFSPLDSRRYFILSAADATTTNWLDALIQRARYTFSIQRNTVVYFNVFLCLSLFVPMLGLVCVHVPLHLMRKYKRESIPMNILTEYLMRVFF